MTALASITRKLRLPVIGAPMFMVSGPELVIAQCRAGIVGTFPALNARPHSELTHWLDRIEMTLEATPEQTGACSSTIAPYGVNIIIHPSNSRWEADLDVCISHRVPLIVTSMHAPHRVVPRVHAYGGVVLHDIRTVRQAQKALEAGVDGLVLVGTGAGGHGGHFNPIALINEIRAFYDGPLALAGCIGHGKDILAARAMGCDLAYIGTRFIATLESLASDRYRRMVMDSDGSQIFSTPYFTGIAANYLAGSIDAAGVDIELLRNALPTTPINLDRTRPKIWRDVWSAGQGVGLVQEELSVAQLVDQLVDEYDTARKVLLADTA